MIEAEVSYLELEKEGPFRDSFEFVQNKFRKCLKRFNSIYI